MTKEVEWFYNESKHCGVDYSDAVVAGKYDACHENFRDFKSETEEIVSLLQLNPEDTVIDLGCGTGGIVVHLANRVKKLYAVDISGAMLQQCRSKCSAADITNVEFHEGGFLTYQHAAEPVDAVISQIALHHLPDMWKQVALLRIYDMLKPGGLFLLRDVVFTFSPRDHKVAIQEWIDAHVRQVGPGAVAHVKEEFSTLEWIMTELIQRAGFVIESSGQRCPESFIQTYLCRKPAC